MLTRTKILVSIIPIILLLGITLAPINALAAPAPLTFISKHAGTYDYIARGAAMRNLGSGTITTTFTGSVVKAYLFWTTMGNTITDPTGIFNGQTITGTNIGSDTAPCWSGYVYTFFADVTSLVINGDNTLSNFPAGIARSDGANPWATGLPLPNMEGASLIVVYNSGGAAREITIFVGVQTTMGGSQTQNLAHSAALSEAAKTTFIVADGQLTGNYVQWNGATIDSNAFPGADPKATSTTWSSGNLWDTKTYDVTVTVGSTSQAATVGGSGDCLTWVGQVLSINAYGVDQPWGGPSAPTGTWPNVDPDPDPDYGCHMSRNWPLVDPDCDPDDIPPVSTVST